MAVMVIAGRTVEGIPACAPVSNEERHDGTKRDRWVEIELYKLDNGDWLAHRVGRSVIYHTADTYCVTRTGRKSGEPASVDDLPDDAVPCERCHPPFPRSVPDGPGTIRMETDWHSWDQAPTPELIKLRLTTARARDGSVSVFMSDLVRHLFENAAELHPEFAELLAA